MTNTNPRMYLILPALYSSVFSNLLYGLLGGPENTFSILVLIFLSCAIAINLRSININKKLFLFSLFVCFSYAINLLGLNWSSVEIEGALHGLQICLKLLIFTFIICEIDRLNVNDINDVLFSFAMTIVVVTALTLPIFLLSDYGVITPKSRFISMDEGNSQRFGGLGFETLDYAYTALVASLILIYSDNKYTFKLACLIILCTGLFFTKSNFISIALLGAISYILIKKIKRKIILIIFALIAIIPANIFLYENNISVIDLIFLRSAAIEEGSSLGERILPGLNLLRYYIEHNRYFNIPAPGVSISTAIINFDGYITFNAWGVSKILIDFGFIGIFIVAYFFRIVIKNLYSKDAIDKMDWILVFSLIYIFAQAGYMNFTAVTLFIFSYFGLHKKG